MTESADADERARQVAVLAERRRALGVWLQRTAIVVGAIPVLVFLLVVAVVATTGGPDESFGVPTGLFYGGATWLACGPVALGMAAYGRRDAPGDGRLGLVAYAVAVVPLAAMLATAAVLSR